MKNYYKILGVKKTASEEEIRAHWIELMRKLHPDHHRKGGAQDERVKEINEAYETLKHSSSRMKYDLKRAYDRNKKGFFVKRRFIPIFILMVLLILGALYLKRPWIAMKPKTIPQNQTNQTNQTGQRNQSDPSLDQGITPPISVSKSETSVKTEKEVPKDMSKDTMQESAKVASQAEQIKRINPIRHSQSLPAGGAKNHASIHSEITDRQSKMGNLSSSGEIAQPSQETVASVFSPIETKTQGTPQVNESIETPPAPSYNTKGPKTDGRQLAQQAGNPIQPIQPKPLVAREEEIKEFFDNYMKRVNQKDLDGFISLFSLKAIQNQQSGLEEIRNNYANFFNQSQENRFQMDDVKVEIYENAVEVKAHYEWDQTLKKGGPIKTWRGKIRWVLVKENEALRILSLDYQHQQIP